MASCRPPARCSASTSRWRCPHIRVDSGLGAHSVIGTDYDPMLAKVVAWGPDRQEALARLHAALGATQVLGVTTNVGFLRRLVAHPEVEAGRLDTELVERIAADLVGPAAPDEIVAAAALLFSLLAAPPGPLVDPWDVLDGWRPGGPRRSPPAGRSAARW